MIRDTVNSTMTRRPGPYEVRSLCERCHQLEPVAKLVRPFSRPLNVCRHCREILTGKPDLRGLGPATTVTATIAEPEQLERPRIAGLLQPGPSTEP